MTKESIINDATAVSLCITNDAHNQGPREYSAGYERLLRMFKRVTDSQIQHTIVVYGRAHDVFHAGPGESSTPTKFTTLDRGCEANITLVRCDQPAQRVFAHCKLIGSREAPLSWLTEEFNPTTTVVGNNVFPGDIADEETGEIYLLPSSSLAAFGAALRVGFDLLSEMYKQVFNTDEELFDGATRRRIRNGDFTISRVQWAFYLPTVDPGVFLQHAALLYGHMFKHGDGLINLAALQGLRFELHTDPETHRVTGLSLWKLHGRRVVFKVVFYDKRERVAQMRQGKTLTLAQTETILSHVRVDVTAHAQGIVEICQDARAKLKRLRRRDPHRTNWAWTDQFLSDDVKPTAWWLQRAVFVLSHYFVDGRLRRLSFAEWLAPYILQDVLRLNVITRFTSEDFHRLSALEDEVARAWRESGPLRSENWAKHLAASAKCSVPKVYQRRERWLNEYRVDIEHPHALYRDLLFFGPNSLTSPEARSGIVEAVHDEDGDAVVRLLGQAADNFDRGRNTIVGAAVAAVPHEMRVRVACKASGPTASSASTPRPVPARRQLPGPARPTSGSTRRRMG